MIPVEMGVVELVALECVSDRKGIGPKLFEKHPDYKNPVLFLPRDQAEKVVNAEISAQRRAEISVKTKNEQLRKDKAAGFTSERKQPLPRPHLDNIRYAAKKPGVKPAINTG